MPIRKSTTVLIASIAVLLTNSTKADSLTDALKRIAELEAKNIALQVNQRRLEQENKEIIASKVRLEESLKNKETLHNKHQLIIANKAEKINSPSSHRILVPVSQSQQENKHVEEVTKMTFEGAYIGINGGYSGGDVSNNSRGYTLDMAALAPNFTSYNQGNGKEKYAGPSAGVQIGYNLVTKSHILLGAEIDADWTDISNSSNSSSEIFPSKSYVKQYGNSRAGQNWIATARGRIGYNYKSALLYITGGLAIGDTSYVLRSSYGQIGSDFWAGGVVSANSSKISSGWATGAGIEYALGDNISIKTEYLYTQIGSPGFYQSALSSFAFSTSKFANLQANMGNYDPYGFHQVRFGVNYHPQWFDVPAVVAAKY